MILVPRPLPLLLFLGALPMLLTAHLLLFSAGRAAAVHFAPLEPHRLSIRSKTTVSHSGAHIQPPIGLRVEVIELITNEKRRVNLPSCKPSGQKTCPVGMVEVTKPSTPNGCGGDPSKNAASLIINGILTPLLHVLVPFFAPACNKHDTCYSSCGETFQGCNDAFHSDLSAICNAHATKEEQCKQEKEAHNESAECKSHENPFAKGKSCLEVAELMYGAVKSGGCLAYADSQGRYCTCEANKASSDVD
ncbi:hypothetical protein FA10DRAFT_301637 [Acaromyces ingoldii]|uniref:Uncharacterized protein n=1 Tax=Acaromyces ingoldii TaxID=215250 RepID=A0A316YQR4_9BASI|nr:hypothetical protein FA10DRAFT_301637 [Acaromyces ingoldii]PWN90373.1 hypothetical protein FA10DRAFT_301637 [Acaromyces ingoldii]